jgi:hypothetical protein
MQQASEDQEDAAEEEEEEGEHWGYQMVLPHHKTSSRSINMPILPVLSKELVHMLHLWQEFGRPTLEAKVLARKPDWKDPETLFITSAGDAPGLHTRSCPPGV